MYRILIVIALVLPLVPVAGAHGPCAHGEDPATVVGPLYLTSDYVLYHESNGHAGLQRSGGACEDENGRSASWDPDMLVF